MKAAICGLAKGFAKFNKYKNLIHRNNLIHQNFNHKFNYDVLIFHEGNILAEHQEKIQKETPNITFIDVSGKAFVLPEKVEKKSCERWGYRHMCRFYAIQMMDYAADYDYIMRLDDDSYIESPIKYDIFEFMKKRDLDFGYVRTKLDTHEITQSTLPVFVKKWVRESHVRIKCSEEEINAFNFYNNFFISKVSFWFREDVRQYLKAIDDSLGIYEYRWGDSTIQALAIKMFSERSKRHKFKDFKYQHGSHNWKNYGAEYYIEQGSDFLRDKLKKTKEWFVAKRSQFS